MWSRTRWSIVCELCVSSVQVRARLGAFVAYVFRMLDVQFVQVYTWVSQLGIVNRVETLHATNATNVATNVLVDSLHIVCEFVRVRVRV